DAGPGAGPTRRARERADARRDRDALRDRAVQGPRGGQPRRQRAAMRPRANHAEGNRTLVRVPLLLRIGRDHGAGAERGPGICALLREVRSQKSEVRIRKASRIVKREFWLLTSGSWLPFSLFQLQSPRTRSHFMRHRLLLLLAGAGCVGFIGTGSARAQG